MNTLTNLLRISGTLLCSLFLMLATGAARAAEGYALEVKVTPTEGEATSTSAGGLALRDNFKVVLPIQLSHTATPATAEFVFDLSMGAVDVTIADLKMVSPQDGIKLVERGYFDGRLYLQWNREVTVYTSATETVSFTVTAPTDDGNQQDLSLSGEELKQIESTFVTSEDRVFAQLYNPTEHHISSYTIRVAAEPAGEFKGFDRVYRDSLSLEPFSEEGDQIDVRLPKLPEGATYTVTLEKATRR